MARSICTQDRVPGRPGHLRVRRDLPLRRHRRARRVRGRGHADAARFLHVRTHLARHGPGEQLLRAGHAPLRRGRSATARPTSCAPSATPTCRRRSRWRRRRSTGATRAPSTAASSSSCARTAAGSWPAAPCGSGGPLPGRLRRGAGRHHPARQRPARARRAAARGTRAARRCASRAIVSLLLIMASR